MPGGIYRITDNEGDTPRNVTDSEWADISSEPYTVGTFDLRRIGEMATLGTSVKAGVSTLAPPPTHTHSPAPTADEAQPDQ